MLIEIDYSSIGVSEYTYKTAGFLSLTHTLSNVADSLPVMTIQRRCLNSAWHVAWRGFAGRVTRVCEYPWYVRCLPSVLNLSESLQLTDATGTLRGYSTRNFRSGHIETSGARYALGAKTMNGTTELYTSDKEGVIVSGNTEKKRVAVSRQDRNIEVLVALLLIEVAEDPGN